MYIRFCVGDDDLAVRVSPRRRKVCGWVGLRAAKKKRVPKQQLYEAAVVLPERAGVGPCCTGADVFSAVE